MIVLWGVAHEWRGGSQDRGCERQWLDEALEVTTGSWKGMEARHRSHGRKYWRKKRCDAKVKEVSGDPGLYPQIKAGGPGGRIATLKGT